MTSFLSHPLLLPSCSVSGVSVRGSTPLIILYICLCIPYAASGTDIDDDQVVPTKRSALAAYPVRTPPSYST
eukprot:2864252-Rhodomonas_salina.7